MKILHLADRMDRTDGSSRQVYLLAKEQMSRGFDVLVATAGGDALDMLTRNLIPHEVIHWIGHAGRSARGFLNGIIALKRLLNAVNPDIVHAHHFYAANQAWFAARKFRGRLLQTVHACIPPAGLLPHHVGRMLIAVSEAVKDHMTTCDPRLAGRISVARCGAAFPGRAEEVLGKPLYAGLLKARESSSVVSFIGRITEAKGWRVMLEALAEVIRTRDKERAAEPKEGKITLLIAGGGPEAGELRLLAAGLAVETLFFGIVEDTQPLLEKTDVLVVPSLRMEGLPMLLIEAGLAGTAVIASATDGIPEIIEDGVTGLLVPPGDAAALAGALRSLLCNPRLRGRLAAALQERAERDFSVSRMTDEVLHVYRRLAGGREPAY